jgi:pimeloyl-ACP methyl ester carboxylesterase
VPGDLPASLVPSRDGAAPRSVFLPGVCSNANAYLQSFPEAASAHGGVVAIDGDEPCRGAPAFRTFSWNAARQHARIQAALRAAGGDGAPVAEGLTIIGYSQGASIAEQLVERWPELYKRVALIGSPADPAPARVRTAEAAVTMSCSRDVPGRMREAARRFERAGVPATYLEMPGCTHGNIADGERVFGEAFDWLFAHARP